jgi:hypothetical protein
MEAIQTFYNNRYFRSRQEARWAVFFDVLGIIWEYEIEGFVLDDGRYYLPNFFLPEFDVFMEVKPRYILESELDKVIKFSESRRIILTNDVPNGKPLKMYENGICDCEVFFFLEEKQKNARPGKPFPFWRFWMCGGDETFDNEQPYKQAIIMSNIARF